MDELLTQSKVTRDWKVKEKVPMYENQIEPLEVELRYLSESYFWFCKKLFRTYFYLLTPNLLLGFDTYALVLTDLSSRKIEALTIIILLVTWWSASNLLEDQFLLFVHSSIFVYSFLEGLALVNQSLNYHETYLTKNSEDHSTWKLTRVDLLQYILAWGIHVSVEKNDVSADQKLN